MPKKDKVSIVPVDRIETKIFLAASIILGFSLVLGIIKTVKDLPVKNNLPQTSPATERTPEVQVKDETADWKTYRNEKYGFEFKYPKDWAKSKEIILSTQKEIQFYEGKNIIVSIIIGTPYSQNLVRTFTLEEWIAENKKAISKYNEIKEDKIILDNVEAFEILVDGNGRVAFFRKIYFQQKGTIYAIEISYSSEETEKNIHKTLSDQILSTFKFTEK